MYSKWRSVLLVEDEPVLRELAEQYLARANHRVISAGSGDEARRIWEETPEKFDVLVTDYSLIDGVTGLELAAQFRQEKSDLAVILVTGYDVDTIRQDCGEQGHPVEFLQKPFALSALQDAVETTPGVRPWFHCVPPPLGSPQTTRALP